MQKLGRNDRCHCGSGLKYKKCCLAKDEASNVTRITKSQPQTQPEPQPPQSINLPEFIDYGLEWPSENYRLIALQFVHNTVKIYDNEHIKGVLYIWNMFVHEKNPVSKKSGVFPAALEYVLNRIFEYGVTQKEIAEDYNISVSTLSQRSNQILNFIDKKAMESENEPELSRQPPIGNVGSSMIAEQEMARLHAMLEEQEFDSMEDVNAFLEQHMNSEPSQNSEGSKEEQAQDLVYKAWDEPNIEHRMKLAQEALLLDPNAIDAYNIFAECAASPKEQAYYYKQAMQVGEEYFGEAFFEEHKGHFWGYVPTRPYMRAKKGYADICAMLDKMPEAVQHYGELLELNPNDNQGVRESLLPVYIELEDWNSAKQLIEQYEGDYTATHYYSRVLVEYGANGITTKLQSLLKEAYEQNPYVPAYLLAKKSLPNEMPQYIGLGDEREAIAYVFMNRHLWITQPELLQSMAEG